MNDLKFALRQLLKHPGFTAVALLTLALGIGANTAVFSVVNGVLLRPLPYPDPDRLVTLWESSPERGIEQERVSGPNFLDWRTQATAFEELAVRPAWNSSDEFNLVLGDTTLKVPGTYASASTFKVFGIQPQLGRSLMVEDDQKEGPRVVVISHALWQRHFGGNPDVLGRFLTIDSYGRRDYEIIGVMPPGFGQPARTDLWLPLGWMDTDLGARRSAHWYHVVGRLKSGISLEQARTELNLIQSRLKQAFPGETIGSQVVVVPLLHQALGGNLRTALLILWGVVAGVLLIACGNVANLLLARAASREKEIALRIALGAGRGRIIRQLLGESVILSLLGGLLGTLLAWVGLRLFLAGNPGNIPRLDEVTLDGRVLLFTLGVAALTGLVFGLAPAWHASRPALNDSLKDSGHGCSTGTTTGRTRNLLIMAEVAMSVVLLVGAGLMLQSFARMLNTKRGFEPHHLVTAQLDFSVTGFTTWVQEQPSRPQVRLHDLMERLRAQPGIQAVAAGSRLLRRDNLPPVQPFVLHGQPVTNPAERPTADFSGISPGWLTALGGRLLQGRDFTEADTLLTAGVALVNEAFVKKFLPGSNPIGQRISMDDGRQPLDARDQYGVPVWAEIVGVVADLKSLHPQPEAAPEVYRPYWQWPMQSPTLLVRGGLETTALVESVRRETRAAIPMIPTPTIRPMDDLLADAVAQPRLQTGLLGLFAALALLLAAVGLYGVLAYGVSLRTREIGIRMALGAERSTVRSMIIRQGMKLASIGAVVGTLGALAFTRVMRGLLYGVSPLNPATYLAVTLVLAGVALFACWLPARRAAKVDPMAALRSE